MTPRFTIGIEEEFQMVDRHTGQLSPLIGTILEKGHAFFGELIKPEMLQSTVEINSDILPDIPTAREEMRTWLPHLLAISSNSPCWAGRLTGLKSYRSVVWKPFPRSGIPEVFPSSGDFDTYVQTLVKTSCIDDLGSRNEIEYLRRLLEDPRGTGADRQIALYEQTGSMDDVIQLLMQQTMQGIPVKIPT